MSVVNTMACQKKLIKNQARGDAKMKSREESKLYDRVFNVDF